MLGWALTVPPEAVGTNHRLLPDGFSMSHPQLREWVPACRQGFTPTPLAEGGSSRVTLAKLIGFIPTKKVEDGLINSSFYYNYDNGALTPPH